MKHSESLLNIAPALARAQKAIGTADKNAVNKTVSSRYADLSSVILACKGALAECGISVLQPISNGPDDDTIIETMLLHESGEFLSSEITFPTLPDIQDFGSSLTYHQRYCLRAMLCIPSADDDGEEAMPAKRERKKREPKTQEANDIASMQLILADHEADAKGAKTDQERKHYLGLASEMRCKIADAELALKKIGQDGPEEIDKPRVEPEKESVDIETSWRDVECHAVSAKNSMFMKKLGEMVPAQIKWLAETWAPKAGTGKRDKVLLAAVQAAVAEGASEKTIAKQDDLPLPGAEPPLEEKKGKEVAKKAIAEPLVDWRNVTIHFPCYANGRKLGEFAAEELKTLSDAMVRGPKGGAPKITPVVKDQTPEDKALIVAVGTALREIGKKEDIVARFDKNGIEQKDAVQLLIQNGVMKEGDTFESIPEELADYILDKWADIETAIAADEKGKK